MKVSTSSATQPSKTTPPFIISVRLSETHKKNLYGCSFNPYIKWPKLQTAAAVGGNFVHLYQFPNKTQSIEKLWTVEIKREKATNINAQQNRKRRRVESEAKSETRDDLYTVCWCYDNLEKQGNNPHKIVCAGKIGDVYIIDSFSKKVEKVIINHGMCVNDIRTAPFDSCLFLTASADLTVRVFHIRSNTCLLMFAGAHCHVDNVLSADWSTKGDYIVSCGYDHRICKWNLDTDQMTHLNTCKEEIIKNGPENSNMFGRLVTQPTAIIGDLHFAEVDCIRTIRIGERAYNLSKACGTESAVCLWRFGKHDGTTEKLDNKPSTARTIIGRKKDVIDGHCWFGKFGVDPKKRWVATGGAYGQLHFHDLRALKITDAAFSLQCSLNKEMIRQVAFSDGGHIILTVGDRGTVCRLDRQK